MIVLTTTTEILQATLGGGVSTTALDLMVVFWDYLPQVTETKQRNADQTGKISSATVSTMLAAPGVPGVVRNVQTIFAYNADVTSATLKINKLSGAVSTIIKQQVLTTGQTLTYEDGFGWQVL